MSVTNDAITVFKNTLFSGKPKVELKAPVALPEEPPSPPTAPTLLEQSLLAVARDNSDLRRSHDAILTKASIVNSLQDDLLDVFDRAYAALEQLAEARSQLAKAEAVAKFEHDAREVASQRLGGMTASYHQTVAELEKLRPEAKRLEVSLRQTSERLAQHETDNATLLEQLDEARAEIERKRSEEAATRREYEAVSLELGSANAYLSQKMTEISQLYERCEIAEQASRASSKALEESRSASAGALVRLDEERVNFASAQSRIAALEAQLKDLGEKFAGARATWSQETEGLNETVARLQDELTQAHGRDEAHQRLLATAQSDLSAARTRNSELESQFAESRTHANQALARATSAEAERESLDTELGASKRLHKSLLRRVKPMIGALRERNAESAKLSATLADFERRFSTFQAEGGETIRTLQDRETHLIAELETERARRIVAEGALAIDRSFRPTESHRRKMESEAPQLLGSRLQT